MIAEPPFDAGATQVRRISPDMLVAAAATERGAVGLLRGYGAGDLLLAGLCPTTLRANARK